MTSSSVIRHPSSIVFMGTPEFAVPALDALHRAGHDIVAVYTQPPRPAGRGMKETPSPVHQRATAHGLKVLTPVSLKSAEAQAEFAAHNADIAVVAAYGLILPPAILNAPRRGCINIHPSLLPRWRGAAPIQRTLMAGDNKTAVCIMQMDEGLDTGGVLLSESFTIRDDMNAGALHDALAVRGGDLTLKALEQLPTLKPQPQSSEGVTYAAKITKEDCRIDWSRSATEIHHQIRALSPAPGAFFEYQGEKIKVFAAAPAPSTAAAPGTVLLGGLTIACGEGALSLLELQRPGKKRMNAEELLRGWQVAPGALFSQA